jgi:hypothetical protein
VSLARGVVPGKKKGKEMSYVRLKPQKGGYLYHQLVESHRVNGQPRQRVLLHLGLHQTVAEAYAASWQRDKRRLKLEVERQRKVVISPPKSEHESGHYGEAVAKLKASERAHGALEKRVIRTRELL